MEALSLILTQVIPIPYGSYTFPVPVYQLLLGGIGAAAIPFSYVGFLHRKNRHKQHYFLSLQFPTISQDSISDHIQKMETLFSSLHRLIHSNTDKLVLEVAKIDDYITLVLGSNNKDLLEQAQSLFSQLEHAQLKVLEGDPLGKISPVFSKHITTSKPFQPINRDSHFFDGILNYLASLKSGEQAGIQIILRGVNKKMTIKEQINKIITHAQQNKRMLNSREEGIIQGLEEKLQSNLFKVRLNLFSNSQIPLSNLQSLLHTLNSKDNLVRSNGTKEGKIHHRFIAPETFLSHIQSSQGMYLTSKELSYLIHPSAVALGKYAPKQTKSLDASPAFTTRQKDNILIGTTESQDGSIQKLFFPLKNFARHLYLVGKTGRGKSTMLTTLLSNLATRSQGNIFVFDPHGDLLEDVIKSTADKSKLVYLNIKDQSKVFTINPLFAFKKSSFEKAAIRDALLDIIQNETEEQLGNYQSGVATYQRLKQILDIGLEFADVYYVYLIKQGIEPKKAEKIVQKRQLTLNDLPLLLEKELEYTSVLKVIFAKDTSQVGLYINKLLEKHMNQSTVIEAVQARLEQLLHSSVRYIVEGNNFSLEKALESNKIFLTPIPESLYGSRGARALMQLLFSFIWIQKRQKSKDRVETYLFIDEFQKAQIDSIPEIISEGRKFKLFLVLSNQQLGQLKEAIKNAILGNMGTLISFTVAADNIGAKLLAPFFGENVSESDLSNLPPHIGYLRTEGDKQKPLVTFSFETIQPKATNVAQSEIESLNQESLEKYGEDISKIEERLHQKQSNPTKYFLEVE